MFNCVITGSTRLSKQRKFRIYVLDNFFGNCYHGSFFAMYGNCCFKVVKVVSIQNIYGLHGLNHVKAMTM